MKKFYYQSTLNEHTTAEKTSKCFLLIKIEKMKYCHIKKYSICSINVYDIWQLSIKLLLYLFDLLNKQSLKDTL